MGSLIRELDWSATALGPAKEWPQSLRTILSVILNSKFPMFLYWGPDLISLYNDAFRPSLGNDGKHPESLGKPGSQFWPEIWSEIGGDIRHVMAGGDATLSEDQLLPINRNGKLENAYWTYSFSPVFDESGSPGGVLVTCYESTQKVTNLAELSESRDELTFAIEATELGTWDLNPKTQKLKVNDRLKEWFGLRPDQDVDLKSAMQAVSERDRARIASAIQNALQYTSGGQYNVQYKIAHPVSGHERIVKAKGRAWFNDEQEVYRFNGTLQDITNEVVVSKRLEESESHFRNMVEQAPVAIGLTRGKNHLVENMNSLMLQLIGKEKLEEVIGKKLIDVLPELEGQGILQNVLKVLEEGEPYDGIEVPVVLKIKGTLEEHYFNISYTPLIEEEEVTGVIQIAVDVTENVLNRKAIEDKERQLRLITNALPVLIGYLDKEEKYRFANQAYKGWFNQDPEALLGQEVRKVVGEKAYAGVKPYIDRALDGEMLSFEAKMPYRENFTKYIRTSYIPDIKNGKVVGFFTLVDDISEQVEIRRQIEEREKEAQALAEELAISNEELRESRDEVLASNEMLTSTNQKLSHINADMDNFIYTASHDLKAPISNIEGLMNAIQRNLSADSKQNPILAKMFGMVSDSIGRFKETISDLTEITKIQRGNSGEVLGLIHLAHVINDVILDLSTQIEQADATFDLKLNDCLPISFSKKNIRSIVYNLISNAVKYRSTDRPLLIKIRCSRIENYLVLSVKDNGMGMDISDKSKIFAMFKRLHDHVEGTGVGLYIVKKIIENAGGKIEVDSKVNEGSTFRVYFNIQK